jgi:hypothetical protein
MGGLRVLTTYKRPAPQKKTTKKREIPDARSTQYFARKWSVSNTTVWRWTKLKEDPLPATKIEGVLRIEIQAANAWWKRRSLEGGQ